ncbi:MAG: response regulator [Rhodospirillaceae bacterium]|nr:response regulator [Rhodospirillaceae bacterium]
MANRKLDPQEAYDFSALSVLLVDDSDHMLHLVQRLLFAMRIKNVRLAADAAAAFTLMKAAVPDIIILDWNMIPLDGIDFIRLVRRGSDSPCPEVAILMLTAHTEAHRVVAARDAGVSWLLAKPVSFKSLYGALTRVVDDDRPFVNSGLYVGPERRGKMRTTLASERPGSESGKGR